MLNFKKRKTAALLAFVSMLCNSSISKALEVTKNPGVAKTLTAEKNAVLNGKKKIVIDWVKNHKILTGVFSTLFLGGIITASVFLAKHIKNKNKIENNGDKPNNLNGELNDLNNEDNGEKNNENNKEKDNESNGSENNTSISSEKNEENDEDNLNNEENENINIINLDQKIENKEDNNNNNENIIINDKKQKIENIKEGNKNIINLDINNEENKKEKIISAKNIKLKFNNKFEFAKPKNMNQKLFEALQGCLTDLSKNKNSIKIKDVADCFNNDLELKKIVLNKWENNPSEGFIFSFYITVKNKKYIIDFKYLKKDHMEYVFDENVDVREVRSSQQLNNKQITINKGVKKRKEEQKNKKKK